MSSSPTSCHFHLPLYLSFDNLFRRQFLRKMWPTQLAFRFLISCRIFHCPLTLSNTSSLLTWSVQLIFILLHQHILKLSRYFWSAARSVQVSAPYKPCSKCSILRFSWWSAVVEWGSATSEGTVCLVEWLDKDSESGGWLRPDLL